MGRQILNNQFPFDIYLDNNDCIDTLGNQDMLLAFLDFCFSLLL